MPEAVDLGYAFTLQPKAAIRYFEQKGYRLSWDWRDTWQEAHAKAFTVAKVARLDVLNDIRTAISDVLKTGQTERWFEEQLTPVLQSKGWWGRQTLEGPQGLETVQLGSPARLKTILRNNLNSAYGAGRYEQFVKNAEHRPYWQYLAIRDAVTRPSHAAMHGRVFRWDDPIWQWLWPPNDFNCRCRVRALSESQVKRRKLEVESSEGRTVQELATISTDKETGEQIRVPVNVLSLTKRPVRIAQRDSAPGAIPEVKRGQALWWEPKLDPEWAPGEGPEWQVQQRGGTIRPGAGWNYNPARAAYMPELDKYPADTARQFVEGQLSGPEFRRWYRIWERTVADEMAANIQLPRAQLVSRIRDRWAVPGKYYPVGILPEAIRTQIGAQSQVVRLSDDTIAKQIVNRGASLGVDDYLRLQATLESPLLVVPEGGQHWMFYRRDDKLYLAVVKTSRSGREVWLQSFRRATEQQLRKAEGKLRG